MTVDWWAYYFSWPQGQVWPNLAASAIATAAATGVAWWRLHVHTSRHAAAAAERHERLAGDVAAVLAAVHGVGDRTAEGLRHTTQAVTGLTDVGQSQGELMRAVVRDVMEKGRGSGDPAGDPAVAVVPRRTRTPRAPAAKAAPVKAAPAKTPAVKAAAKTTRATPGKAAAARPQKGSR